MIQGFHHFFASKGVFRNNPSDLSNRRFDLSAMLQPHDVVYFSGLMNAKQQGMMVFDLDGTFADLYETAAEKARYSDPDDFLNKNIQAFVNFRERENLPLVYASARTLSSFQRLQEDLQKRGIALPTPDYYIANNGNFLYKNVDGSLVLDKTYMAQLLQRTRFNRDAVYTMLKTLADQPKYQLSGTTRDNLAPAGTPQRFTEFSTSQLAYYEFFPSESFVELMYAPPAHCTLETDLTAALDKLGMAYSLTWKKFPASNLDWIASEAQKRPELNEILRLARPTRLDNDGGLYTVHISAARKRTGVEYLMDTLNISPDNVVAAGNDMNDLSLAEMVRDRGTWFISVANAPRDFRDALNHLLDAIPLKRKNRLMQMERHEGNESVRHGINMIRSQGHDTKARYYRSAIDRITAGQPVGDVEMVVLAQFRKPAMQNELEDTIWQMKQTMPDEYPDEVIERLARGTATDKLVIRLLETHGVAQAFQLAPSISF